MGYYGDEDYEGHHYEVQQGMPLGIFYLATLFVFYLMMLFCALGLAAGLFYLAELAEEYTVLARKIMRFLIVGTAVVFGLLKLVDGFSWWRCLFSMAGQAAYYQLLVNFPWVSFTSPAFIASCCVFVIDHVIWYTYFMPGGDGATYPHWSVVSFFILVWLVPLGYFVTLASADQSALPATLGNETAAPKRRTFAAWLSNLLPSRTLGDKRM